MGIETIHYINNLEYLSKYELLSEFFKKIFVEQNKIKSGISDLDEEGIKYFLLYAKKITPMYDDVQLFMTNCKLNQKIDEREETKAFLQAYEVLKEDFKLTAFEIHVKTYKASPEYKVQVLNDLLKQYKYTQNKNRFFLKIPWIIEREQLSYTESNIYIYLIGEKECILEFDTDKMSSLDLQDLLYALKYYNTE